MTQRKESEFESVYHPDDSLQSVEISFFKNNFKYEGDDYQDSSREETSGLPGASKISTRAFSSNIKGANRTNSQFQQIQSFEEIEEISDDYVGAEGLDNILSGIDELQQQQQYQQSIPNLPQLTEDGMKIHTLNDLSTEDPSLDSKLINQAFLDAIVEGKRDKIFKMSSPVYHHGLLDLNFKNTNGLNAVLLCCMMGNLEILKILVNELEGNVSVINSVNRQVGLHYACIQNKHEILQFLLSKNQTLKNFQDVWGGTPLFYAALHSSEKCVEILLNQDANTELLNKDGLSALDVTTSVQIKKMIKKKLFLNSNKHIKFQEDKLVQQERSSSVVNSSTAKNAIGLNYKDELGVSNQTNDVLEAYERTPLFQSNRLACNSRKDRVAEIISKAKQVYSVESAKIKESYQQRNQEAENSLVPGIESANPDNLGQNNHKVKNSYSNGITKLNGFVVSRAQRARRSQVKVNFRKQWEVVHKELEEQKESNERCRIYLQRMKKLEEPLKVRRKVTLDDFIFYRRVGEGSFGEVYLVKIKPGILKTDLPAKSYEERKHAQHLVQRQQPPLHDARSISQQSNLPFSPPKCQNASPPKTRCLQYIQKVENTHAEENKQPEQQQQNQQPVLNELDNKDIAMKEQQTKQNGQMMFNLGEDDDDPQNKFYALKVIKKEALQRKKLAEYIEFEKSVMQEVHHPFVASLHLSFQNDSYLFILMDFCNKKQIKKQINQQLFIFDLLDPGGDLGRILEKDIVVEEKQIKIWAAQMVLALEELHAKDIIYRDLKPENVVLDGKGNLHLIDFGLAKRGVNVLTQSFCGTPIYLPPEIIGRNGHNKMVDWYSLGVIIYELLVGRPPYFSSDCKQLFNDIQTQPLRLPKTLNEGAKSILIQLLRKNYKSRLGYNRDAAEIKEHPWFQDINWDQILAKQYECLKPISLTIPANPMELKLKNSGKGFPVDLKTRWSFCVLEEQTPKQGSSELTADSNMVRSQTEQSHSTLHQSEFHRWNEQLKEETKRLNEWNDILNQNETPQEVEEEQVQSIQLAQTASIEHNLEQQSEQKYPSSPVPQPI